MSRAARRAGSVRFDDYWKPQWRDETSLAWRDVQRSFSELEDAQREGGELCPPEARWRLMRVFEGGRAPEAACPVCAGAGFDVVPDHAPGCDGSRCEQACPVAVQDECRNCGGTGSME